MRAADYLDVKAMLESVRDSDHLDNEGWAYSRGYAEAVAMALEKLEELFRGGCTPVPADTDGPGELRPAGPGP